jgi:general secretion pathway protein I
MRKARGFSLVEILVALTLFAVVGGTILQLFQSGLRTARLADAHTHAVFLARSKLTELQAHSHLQAGTLSGTFSDGYRWQAVLDRVESPDADTPRQLQPLDLILTIRWGESGDEREFSLHSLLLTQQVDS